MGCPNDCKDVMDMDLRIDPLCREFPESSHIMWTPPHPPPPPQLLEISIMEPDSTKVFTKQKHVYMRIPTKLTTHA